MTTLKSTSILASILAQNPYHIISIQGQMPMSHAQNTYDFEIAEDDPHYEEISDYSLEMLWVYTYADKESLELDLMEILNSINIMKPTITVNQYPIGWEWLDRVPLEDFNWLIEIFSTMTDNTDTYDFATFDKEATNGEPPYPVIEINRKGLAHFMNDDQGYESGISMYGHYIACKCLDISSEEEYMNQLTDIRILTNELEPC